MDFVKMHSSGNDFVVVKEHADEYDWETMAKRVCERRFGVGADGILAVLPSSAADLRVKVINSDASEAEICGNGLICLGRYAVEAGIVKSSAKQVTVETKAGIKNLKLLRLGNRLAQVQVNIGKPRLQPEEIPVLVRGPLGKAVAGPILDYPLFAGNRKLLLNMVSMGNPHAVYFTGKSVYDFPMNRLGPVVENHPIFPKRVNFEVARVIDPKQIEARVWERGAGETMACGSGACAIAVAARLHGYAEDKVDILLPGGKLGVEWTSDGDITLTGSPETVFRGTWLSNGGR